MNKKNIILICSYISILLIILSVIFIANSSNTFAWFSKTANVPFSETNSASYDISVNVRGEDGEVSKTEDGYYLEYNKEYTIIITAFGTSSNGYSEINYNGKKLVTNQIKVGENISFKIIPDETTYYEFSPRWGKIEEYDINNNDIIGEKIIEETEEISNEVDDNDNTNETNDTNDTNEEDYNTDKEEENNIEE